MRLLVELHEAKSHLPYFSVVLDWLHYFFEIGDRVLKGNPLNIKSFKEGLLTHPVSEVGQWSAWEVAFLKSQVNYTASCDWVCNCCWSVISSNLLRYRLFFDRQFSTKFQLLHVVFCILFNGSQQCLHMFVGEILNFEANSCELAAFYLNLLKVS